MSMEPSQREYFEQCKAIAADLVREHEGDEEAINDALHETIDGHHYIICTHASIAVLLHSPNDNAYFDDFGALQAESFGDVVAKLAFCAMEADVRAELDDALEAYRAEHESEGVE